MRLTNLTRKEILALYLGFLILTSLIAWVYAHQPISEEFASISVLGSNNTAAYYFPNNITTVTLNEQIPWNLQIYNHMGNAQLFLVYIKLSNTSYTLGPNATSNSPNQEPPLAKFYRAVLNGEIWNIPLVWSVTRESIAGGSTTIQNMTVNGSPTPPVDISAVGGIGFRIIVELWSYDVGDKSFIFSFEANEVLQSIFNQVYFNTA
jgi:hypothetical protein